VKKFFDQMGWYEAEIINAYEGKHGGLVYELVFEDGEEERWTEEERKTFQNVSDIEIGDVGWPFVEKFRGRGGKYVVCSGKVISVQGGRSQLRVCKYSDSETHKRSLEKLIELAKNQFGEINGNACEEGHDSDISSWARESDHESSGSEMDEEVEPEDDNVEEEEEIEECNVGAEEADNEENRANKKECDDEEELSWL